MARGLPGRYRRVRTHFRKGPTTTDSDVNSVTALSRPLPIDPVYADSKGNHSPTTSRSLLRAPTIEVTTHSFDRMKLGLRVFDRSVSQDIKAQTKWLLGNFSSIVKLIDKLNWIPGL